MSVENNRDNRPGEVDLHGLTIKEAIKYTNRAIVKAHRRGALDMQLIVGWFTRPLYAQIQKSDILVTPTTGRGSHSESGQANIRQSIEELMREFVYFTS